MRAEDRRHGDSRVGPESRSMLSESMSGNADHPGVRVTQHEAVESVNHPQPSHSVLDGVRCRPTPYRLAEPVGTGGTKFELVVISVPRSVLGRSWRGITR